MRELIDIDDGLPLSSLLTLNIEVGRLSLVAEKRHVNAMNVAVSALFNSEVLTKYNAETDKLLQQTQWKKEEAEPAPNKISRTMHELSKLNVLLQGGR